MMDLYVPGASGAVNRYYICSERLRDRGWRGVGDIWIHPSSGKPFTFDEALALTGIGRFYAWEAQREILAKNLGELGEKMRPKMDAIRQAASKLGEAAKREGLLTKTMKGKR